MQAQVLSGPMFAAMLRAGAANLAANRKRVNDLNVFPIPDGDTGDNMYMTIDSGAAELASARGDSLGEVAASAAKGMLLGARGNSGVILSRIFAGISHALKDVESADLATVNRALANGVDEAYRAVSVPVEGTILTVYKDAVAYAGARLNETSTADSYCADFLGELRRSLDRTPELLDVLRQAGVVDSGGAGFLCIAEGMQAALHGEAAAPGAAAPDGKAAGPDLSRFTEDSELVFGYCTEFLLRLQRAKVGDPETFDLSRILDDLNGMGESVVCFRDGSIVKVHVHTKKPGDILNEMQKYGEFLTLKIENMTLQHNGTDAGSAAHAAQNPRPHKRYGIVSVASGSGLRQIFFELGCDAVVEGGQSMNPSAEDFVRAFEDINADTILVFPNNGNVVLTARQAAELYDRAEIRIIPTKTVGEGYAGISMLDLTPEDPDDVVRGAEEAVSGVVTGFVSAANRETTLGGVNVHPGDYIGFAGDVIYVDSPDRTEAAEALAEALKAGDYDILLLLAGKDAPQDESFRLQALLKTAYPRTEVILLRGEQPIHDYILILE